MRFFRLGGRTWWRDNENANDMAKAKLLGEQIQEPALQRHDGASFVLGEEHRYRHSAAYLRDIASAFEIVTLREDVFRQEKGVDVPGLPEPQCTI